MTAHETQLPLLLSAAQVAELTGFSKRTVWRKAADPRDRFPSPVRDIKPTRWRTKDVLAYVEAD